MISPYDISILPHPALCNLTPNYVDGAVTAPYSALVLTKYTQRSLREAAVTRADVISHLYEDPLSSSQEPDMSCAG